jgi:hypothetical protein
MSDTQVKVDLRQVNDYAGYRRQRMALTGFAVVSAASAAFGSWALTRPLSLYVNGYGPLYFEVGITAGAAVFLIFLMLLIGPIPAVQMSLDASGFEFEYGSGRTKRYDWKDPDLHLVLLDRILGEPFKERAGARGVAVFMPFTARTFVPPARVDELCHRAMAAGVSVDRVKHPPTGGTKVILTRRSTSAP